MNKLINFITEKYKKLQETGFFHIFGTSVINKVLAFLSSIIIVRLVTKYDYGVYSYANNILSFFMIFSGLGMTTGVFQLCSENSKNHEKSEEIYRYGTSIGMFINVLLGIGLVVFAYSMGNKFPEAPLYLSMMAAMPLVMIIYEFQQILLRSQLKNKEYAMGTLGNTVFIVFLNVIGTFFFGAKGLILGTTVAYIFTAVFIRLAYRVSVPITKGKITGNDKKALYKLSIVSMCSNGLSQLLYSLDILVLGIVLSNGGTIASYKVATIIPTAMTFIPSTIVIYIYPFFASHKDDYNWLKVNYQKLIALLMIFNGSLVFFLYLYAPTLITMLYGSKYLDAVLCFRILVITYFFTGTFRIISGNLLVTQRKVVFNLIISIASGIINVVGNFILVEKYDSIGAAITTLIVSVFSGIISTCYYSLLIKKKKQIQE